MEKKASKSIKRSKGPNQYPAHLSARKVKALISRYESQSDTDAIADAEAAYRRRTTTMIEVPSKLLPQIRSFINEAG